MFALPRRCWAAFRKGTPVDAWAMGIVTLALWTGCVPTSPHFCPHPSDCGDAYCIAEIAKLLPEITDDVWPGHTLLPLWKHFLAIRNDPSRVSGTLGAFVKSNHIQSHSAMFPHYAVQLIELGLQWNPKARSSMKKIEAHVLHNFEFAKLHGCHSANVSAPPGCQPVKTEATSSTDDRRAQGNTTDEDQTKLSMSAREHKRAAGSQAGGETKKGQTRIISTGRNKRQGVPMCLLWQLWIAALWSETKSTE